MQMLLWVGALSLFSAAATLGVIAWRMARDARGRKAARIELLKELAFPGASAAAASRPAMTNWKLGFLSEEPETAAAVDTFEEAPRIFAGRWSLMTAVPRWWISVVGIGAVIAALVGAVSARLVSPDASSATAAASRPTDVPDNRIELLALQSRYERETAFAVTGLVRNPADGHEQSQVMAIVELLDADGRVLASETSRLDQAALEAGQTSAFSLVFQRVSGTVASYNVRFGLASGAAVPHIDRRVLGPAAKSPLS